MEASSHHISLLITSHMLRAFESLITSHNQYMHGTGVPIACKTECDQFEGNVFILVSNKMVFFRFIDKINKYEHYIITILF